MEPKVLEVSHLSFGYQQNQTVLHDVSFSLSKGSHVAVIGHNGSGKSTLAKVILGLTNSYEGQVFLFGTLLSPSTLHSLRSRVGIVFQNPDNQFVGSTVADDLAFGLENRCIPQAQMQQIIETFLNEVGMLEFLEHEPQMLSGGQKQRVAIAGVLAMRPELVIFDEATAMLDPKGKKEIASLIQKMKQDNPSLTILSITHDVEEAASCDEVIVLEQGHIAMQGKPAEVFCQVDKLKELHLSVPFAYELMALLRQKGVEIPSNVHTREELEDYLCR